MQHIRAHVLVCGGTGCKSAGSKEVQLEFARQLEQKGLSDEVMIVETGCHGFCEHGPLVIIYPEGTFYCRVKPEDVEEARPAGYYLPGRHLLLPRKTGGRRRNCGQPPV